VTKFSRTEKQRRKNIYLFGQIAFFPLIILVLLLKESTTLQKKLTTTSGEGVVMTRGRKRKVGQRFFVGFNRE